MPGAVPEFDPVIPFWQSFGGWLNDFARRHGARPDAPPDATGWYRLLERAALRAVLEETPVREPEWATRFRRQALARHPAAPSDLQAIHIGEENVTADFRGRLIGDVLDRRSQVLVAFGVE